MSVHVQHVQLSHRSCNAAGPRVWNCLPMDLRQLDLLYARFKQSLKTFLFSHCDQSARRILI